VLWIQKAAQELSGRDTGKRREKALRTYAEFGAGTCRIVCISPEALEFGASSDYSKIIPNEVRA